MCCVCRELVDICFVFFNSELWQNKTFAWAQFPSVTCRPAHVDQFTYLASTPNRGIMGEISAATVSAAHEPAVTQGVGYWVETEEELSMYNSLFLPGCDLKKKKMEFSLLQFILVGEFVFIGAIGVDVKHSCLCPPKKWEIV